jgi:hypothetical protein
LTHCATRLQFRFPMMSLEFCIDKPFRPHYGPRVNSSSNRNEYQEYFLGSKGGWCIELTTLPSLCADCLQNLGVSTSVTFWTSNRPALALPNINMPDYSLIP